MHTWLGDMDFSSVYNNFYLHAFENALQLLMETRVHPFLLGNFILKKQKQNLFSSANQHKQKRQILSAHKAFHKPKAKSFNREFILRIL